MAIEVNDIQFYYSGGPGSATAATSLGGQISTSRITAQTCSSFGIVTGVALLWAINNAEGNGTLTYQPATGILSWKPPGSLTTYNSVTITGNGTITVGGTDGQLVVQITFASLPTSFKQQTVTVTNTLNNVFDAVSAAESLVGRVEYRCIYVKNAHASETAFGVKVFIGQLTSGPDEIDIGLDAASPLVGNGTSTGVATTIVSETAVPSGVSFSRPVTSTAGLLIGDMAAGQVAAFWQRRTVDANTTGNVTMNTSKIAVALTS
jgi:hypothetical protein